jgi:3-keto-L-gulonate-6-phosphate decarboxylase
VKKTRFTETQIVAILKELDAGVPAAELAGKHGIHANTSSGATSTAAWKQATWPTLSNSRTRIAAKTASLRVGRRRSMQ